MPIFISYCSKDRAFVDNLALNLVAAKHNVWMDRWELTVGDSLTQKIQAALTKCSALLVILSKSSVESEWCKRELSAGLIRELEEKKTLVMPCVIDDCDVPLFLKDKVYADFRKDRDEAFNFVSRSLARISNPYQGKSETPEFHTDWSIDWTDDEGERKIRLSFVDHSIDWPYVIWSQCTIVGDNKNDAAFGQAIKRKEDNTYIRNVLELIVAAVNKKPLSEVIDSHFEKYVAWQESAPDGSKFLVVFSFRRMGADNGMDTLVHLDNNLRRALDHMKEVAFAK